MKRFGAWSLLAGLALATLLGCEESPRSVPEETPNKPATVSEPRPAAAPPRAVFPSLGQDDVIAKILAMNGTYEVDEQAPSKPVVVVDLSGTPVNDAGLEPLRSLPSLRVLRLARTAITDVGLMHVKRIAGLEELDLGETQISDAGLSLLEEMTVLRRLRLSDTRVGDPGLKYVAGLPIEQLELNGTRVTDAGLDLLSGLVHLRVVSLDGTDATDAGVDTLRQSLPNTQINR